LIAIYKGGDMNKCKKYKKIAKKKIGKCYVPKFIKVPVYYAVNESDLEVTYDIEEMKRVFDELLSDLPQYTYEKRDGTDS